MESADKPGSVEDDHSSGTPVTGRLVRSTRRHLRATGAKGRASLFGLAQRVCCAIHVGRGRGALYCTISPFTWLRDSPTAIGGLLSVALSVALAPPRPWPSCPAGRTFSIAWWRPRSSGRLAAVHPMASGPGRQGPAFVISRGAGGGQVFFAADPLQPGRRPVSPATLPAGPQQVIHFNGSHRHQPRRRPATRRTLPLRWLSSASTALATRPVSRPDRLMPLGEAHAPAPRHACRRIPNEVMSGFGGHGEIPNRPVASSQQRFQVRSCAPAAGGAEPPCAESGLSADRQLIAPRRSALKPGTDHRILFTAGLHQRKRDADQRCRNPIPVPGIHRP